jgi:adhesin transport system outer membrane protein
MLSPAHAETLEEAVAQALSSSPEVARAVNALRAREQEVAGAQAGYRPTVDLSAGYGYEYTDSPGTRAAGDDAVELDRGEFGVSATQLLFDGYGTKSEIERQEARRASAAGDVKAIAEAIAADAAIAYVDLLRFTELESLSEESLQVHLRIQDQIRLRSDAGVGRRADLDQVDSRVALAEANLVAAQVNRLDAETTYRRVIGQLPGGGLMMPQVRAGELPGSLEEAITLANAANPQLEVAGADIAAAEALHRAARQEYYPRVTLELGGNLDNNEDGVSGYRNDLSAMLRLRYNLYRGGADTARVREAAYNVNEAKEIRSRTYRQLEEAVRLAWAAYEATARQVPLLEAQVTAAIATREAYEKQFNIGQRTLIDLLNSENEVLDGQVSLVNAKADRLNAYHRLFEAMGRLVEHFGVGASAVQVN